MRARPLAALLPCLLAASLAFAQDAALSTEEQAFRAGRGQAFPLTPEMIDDLARRYEGDQRARARLAPIAEPQRRPINVRFIPGDATPIVQVVQGYPTALSFFDLTGEPWPVSGHSNSNPCPADTTVGNASGYTAKAGVAGGNTVEITACGPFPRGGLVVYLDSAPAPLSFMLSAGRGAYDASASIRVAARGPKSRMDIVVRENMPENGAPYMTAMLEGMTPAGAKPLSVSGASTDDVRAWKMADRIYLRTTYALIAPEPDAVQHAEGGLRVYSVRADRNGRPYEDMTFIVSGAGQSFPIRVRGN